MKKKPSNEPDSLAQSVRALKSSTDSIHIRYLRFPNYKNLALRSKLTFDFPITVLLGRNGTNKSSILHALHGCPEGNTVADFWFETKVDAIPATVEDMKPSVVHAYHGPRNAVVECIKARAPRSTADPDYWETVKPTTVYGFEPGAARVPPVDLKVTHLDFRGELPAFDKYFYFPDPKHLAQRNRGPTKQKLRRAYRKQDYLRQRSASLKTQLATKGREFSERELQVLQFVLERQYVSGRLLKHSLFHGHTGWTIVFTTENSSVYSDAFAGSGESAAALMISSILNAPDSSLILLDEPETSLHPRAQQRLLRFLAHEATRRNLQIVIATHSICFADGLPSSAIRVLEIGDDSRVQILSDVSAREALHEISTTERGQTILVEDRRAQAIVLAALKASSPHATQEFDVVVRDGGTSRIYRDLQAHANSKRQGLFAIFDGDHRPSTPIPKKGNLPAGESELEALISELTQGPNKKGPKLDFVDADERRRYIEFLRTSVRYLPGATPEDLIWSEAVAAELLGKAIPKKIREASPKERLLLLADSLPGHNDDSVFRIMLARFLASDSTMCRVLLDLVHEIRGAN